MIKSYRNSINLSVQPIPEDDVLDYNRGSYSSLESEDEHYNEEDDYDVDGTQNYPTDLLGVSWGSYLLSVPPSRAEGQAQTQSQKQTPIPRKVVVNTTPQHLDNTEEASCKVAEQSRTDSNWNVPTECTSKSHAIECSRGGVSTKTDSSQAEFVQKQISDTKPKPRTNINKPHPLLHKLEELVNSLIKNKEELSAYGLDVSPLTNVSDDTLASYYDLKQLVQQLGGKEDIAATTLSTGVLQNVVDYTKAVLESLVGQGKVLNEQASFLHKTGTNLSKKQNNFLREQREIQQAIESARVQLAIEKQIFEEQKVDLQNGTEELKRLYQEAATSLHQPYQANRRTMGSPHTIAKGRSQLAALEQTQKLQAKLEKVLTQQEREIRSLQREHDIMKTEVLATQDHARKFQQKLAKEVRKSETLVGNATKQCESKGPGLPSHHSAMLGGGKRKSTEDNAHSSVLGVRNRSMLNGVEGISKTQKTLHMEIERIKRHISDQHKRDEKLQKRVDQSYKTLNETGTRLKHHRASIRGSNAHSNHGNWNEYERGEEKKSNEYRLRFQKLEIQNRLPRVKIKSTQQKTQPKRESNSFSLPKLQQATSSDSDGEKSHRVRFGGVAAAPVKRHHQLQAYNFSKTELFTLAKFGDQETAEQVMEWLETQGKLDA